jgi:hypothetical protein
MDIEHSLVENDKNNHEGLLLSSINMFLRIFKRQRITTASPPLPYASLTPLFPQPMDVLLTYKKHDCITKYGLDQSTYGTCHILSLYNYLYLGNRIQKLIPFEEILNNIIYNHPNEFSNNAQRFSTRKLPICDPSTELTPIHYIRTFLLVNEKKARGVVHGKGKVCPLKKYWTKLMITINKCIDRDKQKLAGTDFMTWVHSWLNTSETIDRFKYSISMLDKEDAFEGGYEIVMTPILLYYTLGIKIKEMLLIDQNRPELLDNPHILNRRRLGINISTIDLILRNATFGHVLKPAYQIGGHTFFLDGGQLCMKTYIMTPGDRVYTKLYSILPEPFDYKISHFTIELPSSGDFMWIDEEVSRQVSHSEADKHGVHSLAAFICNDGTKMICNSWDIDHIPIPFDFTRNMIDPRTVIVKDNGDGNYYVMIINKQDTSLFFYVKDDQRGSGGSGRGKSSPEAKYTRPSPIYTVGRA